MSNWKFILEKTPAGGVCQKDHVKEPLGFKQDISEVSVRVGSKSGINH